MTLEHERIQELLAGHALHSLDGDDAREAERALSDHVPGCEECRQLLADFSDVAADLSLAEPAVSPPEILLPRLRREIGAPVSRRSRMVAVAAAAVAVVTGLGVWNAMLNVRVTDLSVERQGMITAIQFVGQPDVVTVAVATELANPETLLVGYRPNDRSVLVVGSEVPAPAEGNEYRLWIQRDGRWEHVTDFVPDDGVVLVPVAFDATACDGMLVTEEGADTEHTTPAGAPRWEAVLKNEDEEP